MAEQLDCSLNHEQPKSQTLAARGVDAFKCIENPRQSFGCNTNTGIVDVDPNVTAEPAAANEDAPSGFGVFDGITYQIAEDAVQEHRIADDMSVRLTRTQVDTSPSRGVLVVIVEPPE
jgi:hypothetical protein